MTQSLVAKVRMGNAIRNFLKCNVREVYIFCCLLDNKNIKTNKEDMMKKIVTLDMCQAGIVDIQTVHDLLCDPLYNAI